MLGNKHDPSTTPVFSGQKEGGKIQTCRNFAPCCICNFVSYRERPLPAHHEWDHAEDCGPLVPWPPAHHRLEEVVQALLIPTPSSTRHLLLPLLLRHPLHLRDAKTLSSILHKIWPTAVSRHCDCSLILTPFTVIMFSIEDTWFQKRIFKVENILPNLIRLQWQAAFSVY